MKNAYSLHKNNKKNAYKLPFENFDAFLEKSTFENKEAICYIDIDTNITISLNYQELNNVTKQIAYFLKENIKKRDTISFCFSNTPEVVLLNCASWRSSIKTVPLDILRDSVERKIYKLTLTKASILITKDDFQTRKDNKLIKKALPHIKIIEVKNYNHFLELTTKSKKRDIKSFDEDETCLVLFTSGTTANPKGVELTLRGLISNAESINKWLSIEQADRFLIVLPLHHINSTTFVNCVILAHGTIVLSSRYSKAHFWEIAAHNKATISSIVPTIAFDLVSETRSYERLKSTLNLTRIQLGSAPVQPQTVLRFIRQFNIPLYQGYGQTETSLRTTGVPTNISTSLYHHIVKLNSIGSELLYTQVSVLDEEGKKVKENEIGEICVRGPILMKRYMKNATATNEAFKYDWFHTGDLGYWKIIDSLKMFFLTGRSKEIIKKSGILISPLAIENALLEQFPTLEKVYVVGFPDARLGENIGVIYVSKDKKAVQSIKLAIQKNGINSLNTYEYPSVFIQVRDEDLPTTSTGKIQRVELKKKYKFELLDSFNTIAKTKKYTFRKLNAFNNEEISSALKIENLAWGKSLPVNEKTFEDRVNNCTIIGCFEANNKLHGIVSLLQQHKNVIENIGEPENLANTWDGLTDKGTFSTNTIKGDILICPSISVLGNKRDIQNSKQEKLINKKLLQYIKSNKDYVLRFHSKPKGGQSNGASFVYLIPNGRPKDTDALGYNVLLKYPTISHSPTINSDASIGVQLIEAVMAYAYQNGIKEIYAYSRPAEMSRYFKK